ncbi:MAG: hypothetical protein ACJ73D_03620 [Pyrinomonadaceae bacterium]
MDDVPPRMSVRGGKLRNNVNLKEICVMILPAVLLFVYMGVSIGWIRPVPDPILLDRIGPLVFLVIGFWVGRLPADKAQQLLREQLNELQSRLDHGDQIKERALREREVAAERIRMVSAILLAGDNNVSGHSPRPGLETSDASRVASALEVLRA